MREINHVDLAFIVDTTGSMGAFLDAAQRQMVSMIDALARSADVSMRLGVVQYRDHPPQDDLVYQAFPFTDDLEEARAAIRSLRAEGGGDGPEAVLDGVLAACIDLAWRPHARRLAVLVGDAPPHGIGSPGDQFARGCPCGQTIESVTCFAEENRVTLYALGLTKSVEAPFGKLASFTGGRYFNSTEVNSAIDLLRQLLADEFGYLGLDRAVLQAWSAGGEFSIDEAALRLGRSSGEVAASVTRLSARQLLARPVDGFAQGSGSVV
jgi:hypothetical protein